MEARKLKTIDDLLTRSSGPGGWWIATEVSVAYEAHECPSHDVE